MGTLIAIIPARLRPSAREVHLEDQLVAAGRHVTTLELRVNSLEREVIAERAQRHELELEVAALRATGLLP